MTIDELRNQHAAALAEVQELNALAEGEARDMTPEESERFATLNDEMSGIEKRIARKQQIENRQGFTADLGKSQRQTQATASPEAFATANRVEVMRHSGALRAFKSPTMAYRAGKWLQGTLFGNMEARDWCRQNGFEERVMQGGINTKGGFTIPDEMEQTIIDLKASYGVLRQEAKVWPMSSDTKLIPRRTGGVTVYAIGETDAITASDMSLDQVQLTARKWGALTYMSSDLAEDTLIDMTDTLFQEMAYAIAKKEDESGVDGDGTSTYHGMVGFRTKMIDGSHDASTVDAAGGNPTFLLLDDADLTGLIAALPDYAHANAKWYISRYGWGACMQRLLRAGGGNTINTLSAEGKQVFQYAGYPVVIMNAMPTTVTTLNDLVMIAFGDMNAAVSVGDRRGITLAIDSSIKFAEDQLALRATVRHDVIVNDIGDNTTAGPLVGLLGTT